MMIERVGSKLGRHEDNGLYFNAIITAMAAITNKLLGIDWSEQARASNNQQII